MIFQCPWRDSAPAYIRRDHPSEALESSGWFCELFVLGVHPVDDERTCDQTDVTQWEFLVVPSRELKREQSSMILREATTRWPPVPLTALKSTVESKLNALREPTAAEGGNQNSPAVSNLALRLAYVRVPNSARR